MQEKKRSKLLDAKENLQRKKLLLIKKKQKPLFCFSLNVPGWPKSDIVLKQFFLYVLKDIKRYCLANRIMLDFSCEELKTLDCGQSYFTVFQSNIKIEKVKHLTEQYEKRHSCGRFIDIDLVDAKKNPVSSKKEKKCFICKNRSAIDCMRNNRHTNKELRNFQKKAINDFLFLELRKKQAHLLTEFTIYALLSEASLEPKPGLVSPQSNGAHSDMNYHTFIKSISALTPIFYNFFNSMLKSNNSASISKLREWGLMAEEKMFESTKKINTHKGVIFLLLLIGNIIIELIKKNKGIDSQTIKIELDKYKFDIASDFITQFEQTNGVIAQLKYPKLKIGIRQQVLNNLPAVFNGGLKTLIDFNYSPNESAENRTQILTLSLLNIISQNQDSNILHRGNSKLLKVMQKKSKKIFQEILNNNWSSYHTFCQWTSSNNLSPGGSADLLALSIFIYLCTQNKTITLNEL